MGDYWMNVNELWVKLRCKLTNEQEQSLEKIIFRRAVEEDHHILYIQWVNDDLTDRQLFYYRRMIKEISKNQGEKVYDVFISDDDLLCLVFSNRILYREIDSIDILILKNELDCMKFIKYAVAHETLDIEQFHSYEWQIFSRIYDIPIEMFVPEYRFDMKNFQYYTDRLYLDRVKRKRKMEIKKRISEIKKRDDYFNSLDYFISIEDKDFMRKDSYRWRLQAIREINKLNCLWDRYIRFGVTGLNRAGVRKILEFNNNRHTEFFDIIIKDNEKKQNLMLEIITYDWENKFFSISFHNFEFKDTEKSYRENYEFYLLNQDILYKELVESRFYERNKWWLKEFGRQREYFDKYGDYLIKMGHWDGNLNDLDYDLE